MGYRIRLNDEGAINLAKAILNRAREDYFEAHKDIIKYSIKKKNLINNSSDAIEIAKMIEKNAYFTERIDRAKSVIRQCERFFGSALFYSMTYVIKENVINTLQCQIKEMKPKWEAEFSKKEPINANHDSIN